MDHSHHEHHHVKNEHQEHDKHAGHSVAMFKDKFWLSLLLTMPVLVYSEMIQHWLNFTPPAFPGSEYVPFVLSTVIFFYGGLVQRKNALSTIMHSFFILALISVQWVLWGFSLSFAPCCWLPRCCSRSTPRAPRAFPQRMPAPCCMPAR